MSRTLALHHLSPKSSCQSHMTKCRSSFIKRIPAWVCLHPESERSVVHWDIIMISIHSCWLRCCSFRDLSQQQQLNLLVCAVSAKRNWKSMCVYFGDNHIMHLDTQNSDSKVAYFSVCIYISAGRIHQLPVCIENNSAIKPLLHQQHQSIVLHIPSNMVGSFYLFLDG